MVWSRTSGVRQGELLNASVVTLVNDLDKQSICFTEFTGQRLKVQNEHDEKAHG
eukprot:SAG31_NODE_29539_length_393_cov_1.397959_1_plen_53_part_01